MQLDPIMLNLVQSEIWRIIDKCFPEKARASLGITNVEVNDIFEKVFPDSLGDLWARCEKNPNEDYSEELDFDSSLPLRAVLYYRVANSIYCYDNFINKQVMKKFMVNQAEKISQLSKNETGVYIHPAAHIGKNFVIEHGTSTAIGHLVEIGDDCYIHRGVTIGSITVEPGLGKHPTIGNNVRIGGCVRIFGPVEIGDNVCISPHCVITENIPADCNVIIINQLQLLKHNTKNCYSEIIIYGICPGDENTITIYGYNLEDLDVSLVDCYMKDVDGIKISQVSSDLNYVKYKLSLVDPVSPISTETISIKLKFGSNMCITKSLGLKHALDYLLN